MSKNGSKKFALGAIIGVVTGLITGLLTAPKSGKETRRDIKDTAGKVFAEAEKRLKVLHSELTDLIAKGNKELSSRSDEAKKELQKAVDAATEAQAKAKEIISAIRSGETANPELEAAIKEVTKAKDSLKKYFKS